MSSPKISVIVPVYNVEQYLSRCIDSILAQTFTDFEVLLIDDGSTDNSGKICDEYAERDSRIRVFHKENGGVSSARNLGLDNAQGEWIFYIDSDDYLDISALDCIAPYCLPKDIDLILFDYYIDYKSHKYYTYQTYYVDKIKQINEILNGKVEGYVWNKVIRKSLLTKNDIKFPEKINLWEDMAMVIKLFYFASNVKLLKQGLYHYAQNNTSLVHSMTEQKIQDKINACRYIERFLQENKIYNACIIPFMKRAYFSKIEYLLYKPLRNYDKWEKNYAVSNNYIDRFNLRFYYKWGHQLANRKIYCIAIIILKSSYICDHIIRRVIKRWQK